MSHDFNTINNSATKDTLEQHRSTILRNDPIERLYRVDLEMITAAEDVLQVIVCSTDHATTQEKGISVGIASLQKRSVPKFDFLSSWAMAKNIGTKTATTHGGMHVTVSWTVSIPTFSL
ncbi:hypothetical protein LTR51_008694 [Lithohypha guttulata]|nr:hypothetical protein LTR51_008694 [Lithohypha guttulata]